MSGKQAITVYKKKEKAMITCHLPNCEPTVKTNKSSRYEAEKIVL